jgi:hypothetical protein
MFENINKLIDFTLEITNGCQFNCTGCNVDKEGNSWIPDEEFKKLNNLIDDLNNNQFKPMNLAIGPTDIMTSINRDKVLTSPEIKLIASKFLKTTINCAFLDPFNENYKDLGKKLNWLLEGKIVKFVIPFEAYHIDNVQYIDRIRKRRDLVLANMPNVKHHKTYLIINYDSAYIYDKEKKKNLTEELVLKIYNSPYLQDFATDLVLPHSRADLREAGPSKHFLNSIDDIRAKMVNARKKYGISVDIAEVKKSEGKDWDIFYKAGNLYMTPFLLEGLASFDTIFKIEKEWSFHGLYEHYTERLVDQIGWAINAKECASCQFVGDCAERGIHDLMRINSTEKCISPAKLLESDIVWNL